MDWGVSGRGKVGIFGVLNPGGFRTDLWFGLFFSVVHLIDPVEAEMPDCEGRCWFFSTTLAWIRKGRGATF